MYGTKWRRCRLSKKNRHSPWVEFFHFNAPKFPSSSFYWERRNFFQRRRWMWRKEKLFFFKKDGENGRRCHWILTHSSFLSLFFPKKKPQFSQIRNAMTPHISFLFVPTADAANDDLRREEQKKNLYSLKRSRRPPPLFFPHYKRGENPDSFCLCMTWGETYCRYQDT